MPAISLDTADRLAVLSEKAGGYAGPEVMSPVSAMKSYPPEFKADAVALWLPDPARTYASWRKIN